MSPQKLRLLQASMAIMRATVCLSDDADPFIVSTMLLNVELSCSRRRLSAGETREQRIPHRSRKLKERRLSAPAKS